MRIVLAMLLIGSPAAADPESGSATKELPPITIQGIPLGHGTGGEQPPTADPRFSGIIIPPQPMADMLPWPRGMVIAPPDIGDRMPNLLLRPWTWGSRSLWQRFGDGLGALWDALQSPKL